MATIVTRTAKGSPLTHAELDANFTNLNTAVVPALDDLYGAAVLADTPFGYWRLRDAFAATSLVDSSGNAFHATPTASLIPSRSPVDPRVRGGLYFPSGTYATLPTGVQSAFPASPTFSVEAWAKVLASGNKYATIVSCGQTANSNTNSFSLAESWADTTLKPTFMVASTTATTYGFAQSSVAIPTGEWVHLVGTYDGAVILLYIDGVLAATTSYAMTSITAVSRPYAYIGRDSFDSEMTNNAIIAEVALYKSTLSAARVAAHYAAAFR